MATRNAAGRRPSSDKEIRHADETFNTAHVIDALGGSTIRRPQAAVEGKDRVDQLRDAGVTVVSETIANPGDDFHNAILDIFDYYCLFEVTKGRTLIIQRPDDIRRAKDADKLGIILGFQDGGPFEKELAHIPLLARLGVRISGLSYNDANAIGDGCYEPANRGLTAFGKKVVLEMNRVGMTVDLSHVGERTSLDAAAVSGKPVVFSHSNAKALTHHPRNLTDDQMRAAAGTGGVVGVCPHSVFCERERGVRPDLEAMLDHIDYIANLIGIDHVGLGTDFFGGQTLGEEVFRFKFGRMAPGFWAGYTIATKFVVGFDTMHGYRNVARGLHQRGYSPADIKKVLGGNFLRVFEQTWPREFPGES
jgi:membrane dipeptidase